MPANRPTASRRAVLGVGASMIAAGPAAGAAAPRATSVAADEAEAQRILERYHSFGIKASGGPGDIASGAWVEGELKAMGYAVARQPFDVPAYDGQATLVAGDAQADLIPQAIVQPAEITGRLFIVGRGGGDIGIAVLPYGRWSALRGEAERQVRAAAQAGAKAVVLVTTGPTGEALALNTPVDKPLITTPAAVLAPREAEPFLKAAAAGGQATFRMTGRSYRRPAFNVTARLDRGAKRWLVISTPRSGWFTCAGERGTGLAAWFLLARWATKARLPVNLALVCTSGHEYEYAGGEAFIEHVAPRPGDTALWVHFGANVAARDWHERGPLLDPLPSADPQRFLAASPSLIPSAKATFAGQLGLEAPYATDPRQTAGELASILRTGYDPIIGIFGSHRFHHARNDDLRCVSPALIPPVTHAFAKVITDTLKA